MNIHKIAYTRPAASWQASGRKCGRLTGNESSGYLEQGFNGTVEM